MYTALELIREIIKNAKIKITSSSTLVQNKSVITDLALKPRLYATQRKALNGVDY